MTIVHFVIDETYINTHNLSLIKNVLQKKKII